MYPFPCLSSGSSRSDRKLMLQNLICLELSLAIIWGWATPMPVRVKVDFNRCAYFKIWELVLELANIEWLHSFIKGVQWLCYKLSSTNLQSSVSVPMTIRRICCYTYCKTTGRVGSRKRATCWEWCSPHTWSIPRWLTTRRTSIVLDCSYLHSCVQCLT